MESTKDTNDQNNDVVTMVDVLNEENEINETSSAVLSGSDEQKCTYSLGYVKRQALYSCLTCSAEAKNCPEKAIGICLACSLTCHDEHELIELYTKRNFKCDCGVKSGSVVCKLDSSKKISNIDSTSESYIQPNEFNRYNDNFSGVYCSCKRPYPDEEDKIEDEMIQCVICEDWYHGRHLNRKIPDSSAFSEMICEDCMSKSEFLNDYNGLAVTLVDNDNVSQNESTLDITNTEEEEESASKKIKLSEDACVRPKISLDEKAEIKAAFWKDGWRKELCKCSKCIKMYEEKNLQYLIDEEDTVHFYEEKGKNKPKTSIYDASMAALSSLDRVNQIDAITSYNRMKEKLFEFLQTFVVNNQIVTEEDVRRFFTTMKNENSTVPNQPHFCR